MLWTLLTSDWLTEVFIAKLDNSWNLLFTKKTGWAGFDYWKIVTVDSNWNVYAIWTFEWSVDIFWTPLVSVWWNSDPFIVKLNSNLD